MSDLPSLMRDGSSPRVRGKPRRTGVGRPHPGLIPARAGKTFAGRASITTPAAHPRACGENSSARIAPSAGGGSSPRVRGKLHLSRDARATKAHPRACGENQLTDGIAGAGEGSSPRVRGKQVHWGSCLLEVGLIPARAGKTTSTPGSKPSSTAHPRACGENMSARPMRKKSAGSSPRVRGKRRRSRAVGPWGGSSPRVRGKHREPEQ